ncbi:MAG: hypothetical protein V7785_10315 [Bermanella sp.]
MNNSLAQESMLIFLKLVKETSSNSALWSRIFQESINTANTVEALSSRISDVIIQNDEVQLGGEALDIIDSFVTRFRSKNHSIQAVIHAYQAEMKLAQAQSPCVLKTLEWLENRDEYYSQQAQLLSKNDSVFAASGFRSSLIKDNQTWQDIRDYCLFAQKA